MDSKTEINNNNNVNNKEVEEVKDSKIVVKEGGSTYPLKGSNTVLSNALVEVKKSVGLEAYSDTNFILYILLFYFVIQKISDAYRFFISLSTLPKQVTEVYNFITKEDILLQEKIDDLMNQLLGVTGADRIAIAKVHNGTFDNTGGHQMKFSVVYEVVDRLEPIKFNIQNVPLDFIREEIKGGSWTNYKRVQRSKDNTYCDKYLDKIGIVAKDYKLLAINEVIYGVMDIHYIDAPDPDFTLNKELEKRVVKLTKQIEETLESLLLKRNWLQKFFSKFIKINPLFR